MTTALPPGPKGKPFVGNLLEFRRDPIGFIMSLARDYGDISHFRIPMSGSVYFINRPDYIKDVLADRSRIFRKSSDYDLLKAIVGEGLLTSEGDFHKRQRRLALPAFHRQRISAYGAVMTEYCTRALDRWHDGDAIDVSQEMMRLTLAIVAKTLFNADVEAEAKDVGRAITDLMALFDNLVLLISPKIFVVLPTPAGRRYRNAVRTLDATMYRIIEERRRTGDDPGDLLSMLLQAVDEEGDRTGMTNQQLRDEAMTIFLAGHETTANALTWTCYLLSQHPDVERKLEAEIDSVLGGRVPTIEDLPRLPYSNMVFTEVLRLYPPAWAIGRRTLSDYQVGEYLIPANTDVILSPYAIQHDSRFFPDPSKFEPERWTPEATASRPDFCYFPFGGGPRTCIGEQFAKMEGVLLSATIAQKWRLRLVPGHPVEMAPQVTLRTKHGMRMIPELRQFSTSTREPAVPTSESAAAAGS